MWRCTLISLICVATCHKTPAIRASIGRHPFSVIQDDFPRMPRVENVTIFHVTLISDNAMYITTPKRIATFWNDAARAAASADMSWIHRLNNVVLAPVDDDDHRSSHPAMVFCSPYGLINVTGVSMTCASNGETLFPLSLIEYERFSSLLPRCPCTPRRIPLYFVQYDVMPMGDRSSNNCIISFSPSPVAEWQDFMLERVNAEIFVSLQPEKQRAISVNPGLRQLPSDPLHRLLSPKRHAHLHHASAGDGNLFIQLETRKKVKQPNRIDFSQANTLLTLQEHASKGHTSHQHRKLVLIERDEDNEDTAMNSEASLMQSLKDEFDDALAAKSSFLLASTSSMIPSHKHTASNIPTDVHGAEDGVFPSKNSVEAAFLETDILPEELSRRRFEHESDEYAASSYDTTSNNVLFAHTYEDVVEGLPAAMRMSVSANADTNVLLEESAQSEAEAGAAASILLEESAQSEAESSAAVAAASRVSAYLSARIPGLKQIVGPIVGTAMRPVTSQLMPTVGSQVIDGAGTGTPQNLKAEVPLEVGECLTNVLIYNLTNLLTDSITNEVTKKLCTALTEALVPDIVRDIIDVTLPLVHDAVANPLAELESEYDDSLQQLQSLGRKTAKKVFPGLVDAIVRGMKLSLVPELTQSMAFTIVPTLAVVLDALGNDVNTSPTRYAVNRDEAMRRWASLSPSEQKSALAACDTCMGHTLSHNAEGFPVSDGRPDADSPACKACEAVGKDHHLFLLHYYGHAYAEYFGGYISRYFKAAVNATDVQHVNMTMFKEQEALRRQVAAARASLLGGNRSRKSQIGG